MSAVLLSNWFPIRAYDSDERPTPPPGVHHPCLFIHSTRPCVIRTRCGRFFSYSSVRLSLCFVSLSFLFASDDLVPCAGRLRAIDSPRPGLIGRACNGPPRIVRHSSRTEFVARQRFRSRETRLGAAPGESRATLDEVISI